MIFIFINLEALDSVTTHTTLKLWLIYISLIETTQEHRNIGAAAFSVGLGPRLRRTAINDPKLASEGKERSRERGEPDSDRRNATHCGANCALTRSACNEQEDD